MTEDMRGVVAPTDTRFRKDQRLCEEGKLEEADKEKLRLEQKQRETRNARDKSGEEWKPKFFIEKFHQESKKAQKD